MAQKYLDTTGLSYFKNKLDNIYVDKTSNQSINGQKDFNTIPRVKVEHETHNLPSEYQEVEYIESSGTQYIDSNYVPNANTKIIFDSIMGVNSISSDIRQGRHGDGQRLSVAIVSNKLEFAIGGYQSINLNVAGQRHLFELDVPNYQGKLDDVVQATFSATTWTNQQTLYFFARHMSSGQDGLGNVRNYSIEVYEQDQLIRQYIPCYRKSDDEPGMYDTVNDVFYTNIGTGTFIVGPDIYPIAYESLLTDANFAEVAFSGNYNDLVNKPTIPTVNNGTLTIQKNGANVATFTANSSSNVTANINIPPNENIINGVAGTNSVQEKMADVTVNFIGRNPNAEALDSTISKTWDTGALANYAAAFNKNTIASAPASFTNGNKTLAIGEESHAEGYQSVTLGNGSHAEGNITVAKGDSSHSEGFSTQAIGDESHAEGYQTIARADSSHSEGVSTQVQREYIIVNTGDSPDIPTPTPTPATDAEKDAVNGLGAHAEGHTNIAFGLGSHAEGNATTAYSRFGHTEGSGTRTGELVKRKTENNKDYYTIDHSKQYQHAEGLNTVALGSASHSEGCGTIAGYDFQTVIGRYNSNQSNTLFEVGNGSDSSNRGNAFAVRANGTVHLGADPTSNLDAATKQYVDSKLYYVTYGSSTFMNIGNAVSAGKIPVCDYNNRRYTYCSTYVQVSPPSGEITFTCVLGHTLYELKVDMYNAWSNSSSGCGTQLYKHSLTMTSGSNSYYAEAIIPNDSSQWTSSNIYNKIGNAINLKVQDPSSLMGDMRVGLYYNFSLYIVTPSAYTNVVSLVGLSSVTDNVVAL